jgi:DNA-binding transcriptional LysR family regulator
MEDWNELRLVLAVHRAGRLTAAAMALGIDHSTAFRRLKALEERLGVRLFERLPGGSYAPTPSGERTAAAAERMEEEALAASRDLTGRDHRLSGRLRVTSSETLAYGLLTEQIAAFRGTHPGITVELAIDNRVLSLSRREADIALRPVRPKERELWGRKLADIAWAVYASRDYSGALVNNMRKLSASKYASANLREHPLIGWDEASAGIAAATWLARVAPNEAFAFRTNSLVNQFVAAKAGIGLAVLPCYLGDAASDLVRFLPQPIPEIAGELWIVTHNDLRRTARVRAFFDLVGTGLAAARDLFEGRSHKRGHDGSGSSRTHIKAKTAR